MNRRGFLTSVSALALMPLIPKIPLSDTLVMEDVVFTASGGSIGPFRYIAFYGGGGGVPMLLDYGSSITLEPGETFQLAFGGDDRVS